MKKQMIILTLIFIKIANLIMENYCIMIIFIDIGTDIYPAIALAYEASEDLIMSRKPRT